MKIKLFVALFVVIASLQAAAPKKPDEQSAKLGWYQKYRALELESKITGRYFEFLEKLGNWNYTGNRVEDTQKEYPLLLQKYPQANGSHDTLMKILTDLAAKRNKEEEDEENKAATLAQSKKGLNPKAKAFQPKESA